MSENDLTDEQQESSAGLSAGAMLREAREAAKLSVEEVASELHLVSNVVVALENGDRSKLPSRVFTLGYLKNYAKLVNIPYEQVKTAFDDFTDDQVVKIDTNTGAVTQSIAADRPGALGGGLGDTAYVQHVRNPFGVGSVDGFVDLLSGDVNWPGVIAALRSLGMMTPLTPTHSAVRNMAPRFWGSRILSSINRNSGSRVASVAVSRSDTAVRG